MKLPAVLETAFTRFNRFSIRERALVAGALVTAVVMAWDTALMQPLRSREAAVASELATMQQTEALLNGALENAGVDATTQAQEQERTLRAALDSANASLASASAGLITPDRMVEVLHDVLSGRPGVRLVSLRNQPVAQLDAQAGETAPQSGPYVHPIELTIEGGYLDILEYLQALESLPWRLYWRVIEIETLEAPRNRARIEITTLSMDKEWMGV